MRSFTWQLLAILLAFGLCQGTNCLEKEAQLKVNDMVISISEESDSKSDEPVGQDTEKDAHFDKSDVECSGKENVAVKEKEGEARTSSESEENEEMNTKEKKKTISKPGKEECACEKKTTGYERKSKEGKAGSYEHKHQKKGGKSESAENYGKKIKKGKAHSEKEHKKSKSSEEHKKGGSSKSHEHKSGKNKK